MVLSSKKNTTNLLVISSYILMVIIGLLLSSHPPKKNMPRILVSQKNHQTMVVSCWKTILCYPHFRPQHPPRCHVRCQEAIVAPLCLPVGCEIPGLHGHHGHRRWLGWIMGIQRGFLWNLMGLHGIYWDSWNFYGIYRLMLIRSGPMADLTIASGFYWGCTPNYNLFGATTVYINLLQGTGAICWIIFGLNGISQL